MQLNLIKIKSVRDLGIQFKVNPHEMIGQDGAYSIPLENEVLWYFGDTLIGFRKDGESIWYPDGKAVGPKDMSGRGTIKRITLAFFYLTEVVKTVLRNSNILLMVLEILKL